jgi:DNA mismatch repair protein MutL
MEMERELHALGFRFEEFGKNTILVSGIPSHAKIGEKELLEGLVAQFKENSAELQLPMLENLAQALAKRAGIKTGQKLAIEEMESLLAALFACSNPNYTPEGKPTFFTFDSSKIDTYFTR